ncbi:MAG: GNAT family N-acetyltransferase [Candidatus Didemnitutus sp.]|nr:GNAT family N-acetyltransferase [Candidatus Didemnitutus sp.]
MNFDPRPILLEGLHVRLEPIAPGHAAGLFAAGNRPEEWTWALTPEFGSLAEVERWIADALKQQAAGTEVTWATVRRSDGVVVGSTRFLDIRRGHRALEIGSTWIAREAQRTALNTEAKLLQLRHAFDDLGAVRVQLKTDERNEPSRRAIARIGGVFEGILRNYQTRYDGFVRNTAMYSLVAADWFAARTQLETRLRR